MSGCVYEGEETRAAKPGGFIYKEDRGELTVYSRINLGAREGEGEKKFRSAMLVLWGCFGGGVLSTPGAREKGEEGKKKKIG